MSFRPRSMIGALLAGLGSFGFAASKMHETFKVELPDLGDHRYTIRTVGLSRGAPLRARRKHQASRPKKHPSRAKPRKRARCKAKRRSHRS